MQQFDEQIGERRLLDIKNMKVGEVKDYYSQFLDMKRDERIQEMKAVKEKIKKNREYEWILVVKTKDGKIIGKIEVLEMSPGTAFFTVDIPNEAKRWKYGEETIKEFLKICKDCSYFSTIQLDSTEEIIKSYIKKYKIKHGVIEVA